MVRTLNRRRPSESIRDLVEFASRKNMGVLSTQVATRSGVSPWLDIYEALPNPDPVLRNTSNTIALLDGIKREAHVKACTKSRKAGVMRRLWKIERYNATPQATEIVAKIFEGLDVREMIRECMDGWGYGYKPLEVLWRREGDLIVPFSVVGKPSQWFVFGKDNQLRMKTGGLGSKDVEPYKFILARNESSYANPYGEAEFSNCFWPTTFKKGGIKFWAIFLEQFGMPHAMAKTKPGATTKEKTDLLEALTNLIQNAAGVFPNDASVELLETKGGTGSSDLYWRHAHYHDGEISKILLGHASAADSTPGKLGNDTSAMDVRSDIIDDDTIIVQMAVDQLIRYIYELNPTLGTFRPRFEMYDETDVDTARADRDFKLMNSGRVILKKDYFLKRYDFDDEDIVVDETLSPQKPSPPSRPVSPPEFAVPASRPDAAQKNVDDMLGDGITDELLQEQSNTLLAPLVALVNKSRSYAELSAALPGLYPDLDGNDIEALLEKAMLLANVAGAASVEVPE
jgi:phage gp29-like protein